MVDPEKARQAISNRLKKLQEGGFWGKFIVTFRNGDVIMTNTDETTPPDKLIEEELFRTKTG